MLCAAQTNAQSVFRTKPEERQRLHAFAKRGQRVGKS